MKRFLLYILCLSLFISSLALGHSGRTDSSGGHWDRKNGTGYHYHHGYPAHQHPNGICPYQQSTVNNDSQNGLREDEVIAIQTKLTELGYYTLEIDGVYGNGTKKAVMKFQKENGLVADGICGPKTKAALGL